MDLTLESWERNFRLAAKADDYAGLRDHLERLGLPDEPELLLEGTVRAVQMMAVYAGMEGGHERFGEFLEMQAYDPRQSAHPVLSLPLTCSARRTRASWSIARWA